jgi:hypothetical protein
LKKFVLKQKEQNLLKIFLKQKEQNLLKFVLKQKDQTDLNWPVDFGQTFSQPG